MMWSHNILVPCEDCGETFNDPEEYIKHIFRKHPPTRPSAPILAPPLPPSEGPAFQLPPRTSSAKSLPAPAPLQPPAQQLSISQTLVPPQVGQTLARPQPPPASQTLAPPLPPPGFPGFHLPQLPPPVAVGGARPVLVPGLPPPARSLVPNFSIPPPPPAIMNPAMMRPPYMNMMQDPVFRG